jgi:undecaprenyl-diphosphatase
MTDLLQFDRWLFHAINDGLQNPVFDLIAPYWREKEFWIPLYVLLAGFVAWKFRWKVVYFVLAVALTVTIADQTSSELVKKHVERLRPCNDPAVRDDVRLLISCGSGYSFTSSHAANHFAAAVFLAMTLGAIYRRIRLLLLLWAASVALAQVYVGVHYPLDVIGGGLLGAGIGFLVAKLYLRLEKLRLREAG